MNPIHRQFLCHANLKVAEASSEEPAGRYIEGYASTIDPDRVNDIVKPGAFAKTVKTFLQNPIVFFNHNWAEALGKVVALRIDEKGLWVKVKIAEGTELADKTWKLIQQGMYNAFSFGFKILKFTDTSADKTTPADRVIEELDLYEVSVVTVPAQANACFSLAKGLEFGTDMYMNAPETDADKFLAGCKLLQSTLGQEQFSAMVKGAIVHQVPTECGHTRLEEEKATPGFSDFSLAEAGTAWSKSKAEKQMQKWASSDGSGDKDKVDWAKYAKGHFWYDPNDKENIGAYKLPFIYIVDGKPTAVPKAVFACAAAVQGARGGLNIPDADVAGVKAHIKKYYKKMDKPVPWDESTALPAEEKVGRVLSANNEGKLKKAHELVGDVLSAVAATEESSLTGKGYHYTPAGAENGSPEIASAAGACSNILNQGAQVCEWCAEGCSANEEPFGLASEACNAASALTLACAMAGAVPATVDVCKVNLKDCMGSLEAAVTAAQDCECSSCCCVTVIGAACHAACKATLEKMGIVELSSEDTGGAPEGSGETQEQAGAEAPVIPEEHTDETSESQSSPSSEKQAAKISETLKNISSRLDHRK